MVMERKEVGGSSVIKQVGEGKVTVRIAMLGVPDFDNDVIEHGFFSSGEPHTVSIQPFHRWDVPSLGHARVKELGTEVLAELQFNDTSGAREMYDVIAWDADPAHAPPIQQYSWGFRVKSGSDREDTMAGRRVRRLGPAPDGSPGCDLMEVSPVLRGASIGTGTVAVRSQGSGAGIGPGHPLYRSLVQTHQRLLKQRIAVLQGWQGEQEWFRTQHAQLTRRPPARKDRR